MKKIFFDVGANNGDWGIEMLNSNPGSVCYGFEPTPQLIHLIKQKLNSRPDYILEECAVSDVPGKAKFNISGQGDWGCSSLLDFKDKTILNETWPGRWDINKTVDIEVECFTMKQIVEKHSIENITYFHCDTQGMDLNVLKSFGDKLHIIEAGVIEAASTEHTAIYVGQESTKHKCIEWLQQNGFNVTRIEHNDPQQNEVNIYFERK